MRTLSFIRHEAWNEFRAGLRGPMVPTCLLGLAAYLLVVVLNADYMRQMGGTDVARNSPFLVYLMVSGQAVWLWFAWAWVFSQVVVRDRSASLHEVVLAAPMSLRLLLFARYLGAVGVACLLTTGILVGFLLVPVAGSLGFLPPEAVGPTPWLAFGHAMTLYVLPGTLGIGALFVWAAVRTRSPAGPFALAAVLMLVWMVAMVVVRGADAHNEFASMIDPSGYAETDEQSRLWTPREKQDSLLAHTGPLMVNRLVWFFGPLVLAVFGLLRTRREQLVLDRVANRDPGALRRRWARLTGWVRAPKPAETAPLPNALPASRPSCIRVATSEAAWHLSVALRGWGLLLGAGLLVMMGVGGSMYNIVMHADGPLVPRSGLLLPLLSEFSYLVIVFMVAGFVGVAMRRDERPGYGEMVDATPAPLGARLAGRVLAVCGLTLGLSLTQSVSAWLLMAIASPADLSFADPPIFFSLLMGPAFLEICAITLLVHALFRSAGLAHAAAMILAFVAILNHETSVVTYPPAEFGVPVHAVLSEFLGWTPWLGQLLTGGAFKLGLLVVFFGIAWLAWPRGTATLTRDRFRSAAKRLAGGAGAATAAGILLMVTTGALLHHKLVNEGGYRSAAASDAEDAAWEQRFWNEPAPFSLFGGDVRILVNTEERFAEVAWTLRGVRSRAMHGTLPLGAEINHITRDENPVEATIISDHFEILLPGCENTGCDLRMDMIVRGTGWPSHEPILWVHPRGAWLRAEDVLPSLGLDPDRLVRAPSERRALGLEPAPVAAPPEALASAAAVAPTGSWTWSVDFDRAGFATGTGGSFSGPLDFAVGWWSEEPRRSHAESLTAIHGLQRLPDAEVVLQDTTDMQTCVANLLGEAPLVEEILQAPRERGVTRLHGDLLWLPENEGWDVSPGGFGHWQRRARIATAIAAAALTNRADLRKEPGETWLRVGIPGWVGLECVRRLDGVDAWIALNYRGADHVAEAFGDLEAPAESLAEIGDANWKRPYAPLATAAWAEAVGSEEAARLSLLVADDVGSGSSLASALRSAVGNALAEALLGPPASSDVVITAEGAELLIEGYRWKWRDGAWEPETLPVHATQRLDGETGDETRRIGPLPRMIEPAEAGFTLLDAWPTFERTPADNVWREER